MYLAFLMEESLHDDVAIAFMSPKWKNYLHSTDQTKLQADPTFYVSPKQFSPLLNVFLMEISFTTCNAYSYVKKDMHTMIV